MNKGMSVRGISWCLPERFETNEDLVREFGAWTPEKIYKKTGVVKRHIADADKPVSHYLTMAGEKFFREHPEVSRDSVDMLVVCCEARDYVLPATACVVHYGLGLRKECGAVDYELGCSGYVYGLSIAKGYIASGVAGRVLLITGDAVTRYINRQDKAIRTIFGDGYTATLLEASERDRVTGFDLGTDGSGLRDIIIEAGETALPCSGSTAAEEVNRFGNVHSQENLFMNGRRVLEFAQSEVPGSVRRCLERAGVKKEELDLIVFHQASSLVLEQLRDAMGFPADKFVISLEDKGNTASSTIPIALAECAAQGRLKSGMKVLLSGFGVGLSWGTALMEWGCAPGGGKKDGEGTAF